MATISKGIALPATTKRTYARKLSPVAQEIVDTLAECEIGDSFAISGKARSVALVAGKMAKKLGVAIRTAPEGETGARIWRIAPKPAKVAAAE